MPILISRRKKNYLERQVEPKQRRSGLYELASVLLVLVFEFEGSDMKNISLREENSLT